MKSEEKPQKNAGGKSYYVRNGFTQLYFTAAVVMCSILEKTGKL